MHPGDLVYHCEDIKEGGPIPGLVVALLDDDVRLAPSSEAVVCFVDRSFAEYHKLEDLIKVEDYEGEDE